MEEQKDKNLIAFVGKDHLLNVTKEMMGFLNKGEDFLTYQKPTSFIEDSNLLKNDNLRHEYIKRHALNSIIYDEGGSAASTLPFIHKVSD